MPRYEVLGVVEVEYVVSVKVTASNEDAAGKKGKALFEQFDYRSTSNDIEVLDEQISVSIDEVIEI